MGVLEQCLASLRFADRGVTTKFKQRPLFLQSFHVPTYLGTQVLRSIGTRTFGVVPFGAVGLYCG